MAYNALKPAAGDKLSVSQGDIQGNFAALKTLIDTNHGTFGAATQGQHKFLQMPEQSTAIGVTAAVTGNFSGNAPAVTYAVGQYFIIKTTTFTVASIAAGPQALTASDGTATGTFNASTGALVITGNNTNALENVYFIPITNGATTAGLYAVEGTLTGLTELVFRRELNGVPISFTEADLGASFADGWSRFPSGLIMKWGRRTGAAAYGINLDAIGPAFTTVYSVSLTTGTAATTAYVTAILPAATVFTLSGVGTLYWTVIGA